MSAFDSYADLQTTIATYLQRNNLTAMIPIFITLAESRLNKLFNTMPQQLAAPYSITVLDGGSNFVQLPSDFNSMSRVTYNSIPLEFVSLEQASVENSNYNLFQYTLTGTKLWLQTLIDGSVLTMYYFSDLEPLSTSNASNWLLEDYPDVYLYGCLMEAAPYMVDDSRIMIWEQMLTAAITDAKNQGNTQMIPQKTKLRTLKG